PAASAGHRRAPSPASSDGPLISTLPADDAVFQSFVGEFEETLRLKVPELCAAWSAGDLEEVGRLAHWLKGTAGSVGFAAFTTPAADLERRARTGHTDGVEELVNEIKSLARRVSVPNLPQLAQQLDESAERALWS